MKLFSLLLSVAVFFIATYFLIIDLPFADSLNDAIYIALLVVLMAICVVGVLINSEFFERRKSSLVVFIANNLYGKRKK
ncbi:MAG: hypothetical protein EOO45_19505 [Flavobacterium sp.]|nr:MAG: hypothetical protein EOO45_19505 [Flavobacterium sp.]